MLILLAFVIGPLGNAIAQEVWYEQQQVTVAWDAVSTFQDGSSIPSGNVISYEVFIKDAQATNATEVQMGTTQNTEYTVTLQTEGEFLLGVRAVRSDSNGNVLSKSTITWSSDSTVVTDQTFGVRYYQRPAACTGLRKQ